MTIYYPDIASYQAGIDLKGALAVCAKATEGTTYTNPFYGEFKANAGKHSTFFFAYHFLHHGNPAAQAEYCRKFVGGTPLMIDAEPTGNSRPTLYDIYRFADVFRNLGGVVWLVYLPRWYWAQSPLNSSSLRPLSQRGLLLVSSAYTGYTDADTGVGWQPYGGMTPTIWQYTDALSFNGYNVDFNAFRGTHPGDQSAAAVADTLKELKSIVRTGKYPSPATGSGTISQPVQLLGEDNMLFLFEGADAVTPLIVPAGAKKLLLSANNSRQKLPGAKLRIIFNPKWADKYVTVNLQSSPLAVDIPDSETNITVLREDAGNVHVVVAFA